MQINEKKLNIVFERLMAIRQKKHQELLKDLNFEKAINNLQQGFNDYFDTIDMSDIALQFNGKYPRILCVEKGDVIFGIKELQIKEPTLGKALKKWNEEVERVQNETCQFMPVKQQARVSKGEVILPVRGTEGSAGYDFYAPFDITIQPHEITELISSDVKCRLPKTKYLQLYIRSSLAVKHGVMLVGSGVIDSDYFENPENDGNIGACFYNTSNQPYTIKKGERCMQGIILDYYTTVDDKPLANNRDGGYGSTGKKWLKIIVSLILFGGM